MGHLVDIIFPTGQQEGTESVVSKWLKSPGEAVKQHEPLVEISTDKVMMEVSAPCSGVLHEILRQENDKVEPGTELGRIAESDAVANDKSGAPHVQLVPSVGVVGSIVAGAAELSPAVKKLLKDNNLNISDVVGSGKGGRITPEDVQRVAQQKSGATRSTTGISIPSRMIKHDAMRFSIAQHMQNSLASAPHVTTVFEADMSAVLRHKSAVSTDYERQGVKLTLTAYFVMAAVAGIKAVPLVNSRWHDQSVEVFEHINIGVATALEDKGLIVPVVTRAESQDLLTLARSLQALTSKAREGKLEPKDVQGGTFTISNHGVSGSLFAAPIIINQPQSAILGIGKLESRVTVEIQNGEEMFVARPKLYVTLTIDHRVLDGFQANSFLAAFIRSLESWSC